MENKTITITKEQFDDAVKKAIPLTINDVKKSNGSDMMMLLVPIIGITFAEGVRDILFGEQKEQTSEETHDDGPHTMGLGEYGSPLGGLF